MRGRNKKDEAELLRQFRKWREDCPLAGILCAIADPWEDSGGFAVQTGSIGCEATALIAIAGTILGRAGARLASASEKRPDLIERVEQARAALDFETRA